jgi:hypothetical protein
MSPSRQSQINGRPGSRSPPSARTKIPPSASGVGRMPSGVSAAVGPGRGVAEGADDGQVGGFELGRMTNQDVLHAMS